MNTTTKIILGTIGVVITIVLILSARTLTATLAYRYGKAATLPTPTAPAATATPTPELAKATPTAPAEQPAAIPVAGPYISLNYDETNSDPLTPGQKNLVAVYLREAMRAGGTQTAMETAIRSIQNEAQEVGATVKEGESLTLPRDHAWLVWCPNATNANVPPDVSDVFGTHQTGLGKVWIVIPFAPGVPWPQNNTFTGCIGGKFWSVAVH